MSKIDKNKTQQDSELLGMETALMISTAPARSIDVSIWFNEKSSGKGKMNQRDFDARLVSLSATMSINQDAETKKELELAVSPLALRMIHSLCTVGEDENRQPVIDVTYFFKLCEERVSRYLEEIERAEKKEIDRDRQLLEETVNNQDAGNFRSWVAGEYDIEGNLIREDSHDDPASSKDLQSGTDHKDSSDIENPLATSMKIESNTEEKIQIIYQNNFHRLSSDYSDSKVTQLPPNLHEDDDDFVHVLAEEYIKDIREKAMAPRPKSAPSGRRGNERGETVGQVLQYSKDDQELSSNAVNPPLYDEEQVVAGNEAEDVATVDYMKAKMENLSKKRAVKGQPFDIQATDIPVPRKRALGGTKPSIDKKKAQTLAKAWHEENQVFLTGPTAKPALHPSPQKPSRKVLPNGSKTALNPSKPRPSSASQARSRPVSASRGTVAVAGAGKRASTTSPGKKRGAKATENDVKDLLFEEAWRQQLRDDPLSFIFPKSSPDSEPLDPKRRNSFGGFARGSLKPRSQPHFHSTQHLKPSQLTDEEVDRLKDVVEDLIREVVKKTDLYHRLQISLGYVEDYVLIPPRGEIIQSRGKDWVSDRELHSAFLSARLFLNDQQLWVLKRLVTDFSLVYRKLYQEKAEKMIKLKDEVEEKLPKSVRGPGNLLSNEWLKKYLVHLRLTKRDRSNQAASVQEATIDKVLADIATTAVEPMGEDINQQKDKTSGISPSPASNQKDKTPVPWKEWLARKLQAEISKGPFKPKEFMRILSGNTNTTLSREEIDLYLKNHSILPEEALLQEIEYRIEAWILDTDGRRDFQHQLNMKTRAYIWEQLILKGKPANSQNAIRIPPTEKLYWKLYYQLSGEERERVKNTIVTKLIAEKREEFKSAERLQREVTKGLFWQYFQHVKDRGSVDWSWNQWLVDHLEKFGKSLDKYKQEKLLQREQSKHQQQRKKSLAPLVSLEKSLKSIATHLDHHHQLQLQKGIIHLRRLAKEKGIGNGEVVTKEDFDHHIKSILVPYISLDETILVEEDQDNLDHKSKPNVVAKEWKERISRLFTLDSEQTLQQVMEDHKLDDHKNKISFEKWIAEKNRKKEEKAREEEVAKEAKLRENEMKRKNSEKAYKKWLRLRRKNKYKSMVDSKNHELPSRRLAEHRTPWITHEHVGSSSSAAAEQPRSVLSPKSSVSQRKLDVARSASSLTSSIVKKVENEQRSKSSERKRFSVTHLHTKSKLAEK